VQDRARGTRARSEMGQMPQSPNPILEAVFELLKAGNQRCKESLSPVLVSLTRPIPTIQDPLSVFRATQRVDGNRSYWALPAEQTCIVTAGEAAVIRSEGSARFQRAVDLIREMTKSSVLDGSDSIGPTFVGGFGFNSEASVNQIWAPFGDGALTLPRWMFSNQPNGRRFVTINLVLDERTNIDSLRRQLSAESTALFGSISELPRPPKTYIKAEPVVDHWQSKVEEVLDAIKNKGLAKVTLARLMNLRSTELILPELVLQSLQTNYPECHVFAFCRSGMCFLGASPEELVSLHGNRVTSTCLAGSAPRGESEKEDSQLSSQMLDSQKERREHAVVVDWISERMERLCSKLEWDEVPNVLRLGNVQHLATRFVGTRKNGCHVLSFVEALHPTPAVGGIPLQPALELIKQLEEFDRGWYAGPVGWVDREGNGEFAIAIRCALLRGNEAYLYAGAGIVSGSDPEREDQETMMKFKPLLTALNAS